MRDWREVYEVLPLWPHTRWQRLLHRVGYCRGHYHPRGPSVIVRRRG